MRHLLWRELRSLRTTPASWIVAIAMVFFSGVVFLVNLDTSWEWDLSGLVGYLSYLLLFIAPALTMNAVALERQQGTWQLVRSDPILPSHIVMAKYFVVFFYYMCLVALTAGVAFYFIVQRGGEFDLGRQVSALIAHLLMAGFFLAIGFSCSAHCRTPLVSFFLSFTISLSLILAGGVGSGILGSWSHRLGVDSHLNSFRLGLIPLSDLFYFISGITVSLVLSVRAISLETAPQWKRMTGILWIFLWVLLQGHAEGFDKNWDLSRLGHGTPSSAAIKQLQGSASEIKVTAVWDKKHELSALVTTYLSQLGSQFPDMEINYLDLGPDEEIIYHRWQELGLPYESLQWPGGLLIENETRHHFLPFEALLITTQSPGKTQFRRWLMEPLLVQGILSLKRSQLGHIAILNALGSEVEGPGEHELSFERLRLEGFQVESISLNELESKRHPVAFLCNPRQVWSEQVKQKLDSYRQKGGWLVACLEVGSFRSQDYVDEESQTLSGFHSLNPDWVPATLPDYFQSSFGDYAVVMDQPITFTKRSKGVLFQAQGYPVGVQLNNRAVEIGDVDWLRGRFQNNLNFANSTALLFLVEKFLGEDAHHYVKSRHLDVEISALSYEARQQIENWMLVILPFSLALLGILHWLKRRWT